MAIVVQYQPDQVQNTPVARPQISAADPVAAAGERLGGAISNTGNQLSDLAIQAQERLNQQAKTQALTAFTKAKNEYTIQEQAYTGQAALPSNKALPPQTNPDPFGNGEPISSSAPVNEGVVVNGLSKFDKYTNEYLATLTNERQKQEAANLAASARSGMELDLLRHQHAQSIAVDASIANTGIETQLDNAVRYAFSINDSTESIKRAAEIYREHASAPSVGVPQETIDLESAKIISKGQLAVIAQLAIDNPIAAMKRFVDVRAQIDPIAAHAMEQKLKTKSEGYEVQSITDKLKANHSDDDPNAPIDVEAWMVEARTMTDIPERLKAIREDIRGQAQDRASSTKAKFSQAHGEIDSAGADYWDKGKQMPMSVLYAMDSYADMPEVEQAAARKKVRTENLIIEDKAAVRISRDRAQKNDDLRTAALIKSAQKQSDREKLAATKLTWTENANLLLENPDMYATATKDEWAGYADKLSHADFAKFTAKRAALAGKGQQFAAATVEAGILSQYLTAGEFNDPDKRAEAAQMVTHYLAANRKGADHVFGPKEVRDLTIAALQDVVVNTTEGRTWYGKTTPRGEIKRLGDVKDASSIVLPPAFRAQYPGLSYARQVAVYKETLKEGKH